jgi:DNA polymerase III delta prime subunit
MLLIEPSAPSNDLVVEKFIEKNRLPHLLFYGPPGTGKTSTILAVARRIYGNDYRKQTLEVRIAVFRRVRAQQR